MAIRIQGHKNKLKLARRLMTKEEIKKGVTPFNSEGWTKHAEAVAKRTQKRAFLAHARKLKRDKK